MPVVAAWMSVCQWKVHPLAPTATDAAPISDLIRHYSTVAAARPFGQADLLRSARDH